MSIEATRAVVRERGISTSKRCVLFSFANQADNAGYSWLSIATVAVEVELTPRHTRRLCIELVSEGRLNVVYRGGGRSRPSLYRVLPAVLEDDSSDVSRLNYERRFSVGTKGDILSPFRNGQRGTPARVKGDTGARKGGHPDPPTLLDTKETRDDELPELPPREPDEPIGDYVARISEVRHGASDAS